jgi:hypothetical protein
MLIWRNIFRPEAFITLADGRFMIVGKRRTVYLPASAMFIFRGKAKLLAPQG